MPGTFLYLPHACERPGTTGDKKTDKQIQHMPLETQWRCDECGLLWTLKKVFRDDSLRAFMRPVTYKGKPDWTWRNPSEEIG